jgi:hypothetical protein
MSTGSRKETTTRSRSGGRVDRRSLPRGDPAMSGDEEEDEEDEEDDDG